MDHPPAQQGRQTHNQFQLLAQRRFAPYFIVTLFGAFNDNVFRQAIIGLLGVMVLAGAMDSSTRGIYTQLAPAVFILPYFLFSATAGQIAEKLEKARLIRIVTLMEIAIMSVAALGFWLQDVRILLAALFATGLQSALFGPVKYSILPSVLRPEELTGGNGLVEMGTSISILLGMVFGGLIFAVAGENGALVAGVSVIALAVAGNITARFVPPVAAAAPGLKVSWNPLTESLKVWLLTRKQLAVRNSVLGVSWFWFTGTILTGNLPVYAETHLGGTPTLYVFALAVFSVGVGVGSLLCEKLSTRTVEIGLVPLGAAGMSACILHLALAPDIEVQTAGVEGLSVAGFLVHPGAWRIVWDLAGIGFFAGLFVVPLFALIQSRTPPGELSRTIAGMNIQNAVFIVAAAVGGVALQQALGWSIPTLFLALGLASIVVALWIFTIVPEFAMRFVSWLLVKSLYRLRVRGIEEHVPDEGPALLVCNHVSYMDALILAGAIPRPVRFVMHHRIFAIPGLNWIFRTARAIPIASSREDPVLMQRAFDEVDAALANGELVGIFPEGALTSDGDIGPFKSGVEKILARRAVPVVPMALRGMWASMWSRRDSRMRRARLPRRFRAPVEVVAAPPVDGATATAESLEARVRALRGEAA
jgi:1-acyl-sn-glycerol-3-phosphate acyltransferase